MKTTTFRSAMTTITEVIFIITQDLFWVITSTGFLLLFLIYQRMMRKCTSHYWLWEFVFTACEQRLWLAPQIGFATCINEKSSGLLGPSSPSLMFSSLSTKQPKLTNHNSFHMPSLLLQSWHVVTPLLRQTIATVWIEGIHKSLKLCPDTWIKVL